jgi:tungstate transport system substrate-binding protein
METNDFMMATLRKANEVGGYFMTDSSTWVAGKKDLDGTTVLFRGDPFLVNTYHALAAPEGATPAQDLAAAFIEFVGSEKGQEIIGNYGTEAHGEPMYNDAEYAEQFAH